MADHGITIVVKGDNGTGRTQMVEVLKQALLDKGFTQVAVVDSGNKPADLYAGTESIRNQPILITEGNS